MEENYLERIKNLKSEKKITNEQLSRMTGIPLGTLSKFLAGISDSVKLSNIIAVCNALDCSLDYIISGQPENTNNYTLDMGEIKLIEDYRRLDAHGRELVLLVQNCDAVEVGEPCIYILDGNGYFKIFGGDCLISLNPDYGKILLKDFSEISCAGKVLGRLKKR